MARAKQPLRRPTPRTVELLGLEQRATLPPASRVKLTRHAIERYRERVAGIDRVSVRDAERELRELMRGAKVRVAKPQWCGPPRRYEDAVRTVGYVIVERSVPPCALPLEMSNGAVVATTCLVPRRAD